MAEALPAAYERLHAYGPEFGGDEEGDHGLTNHGPMAVEVLARRGYDGVVGLEAWASTDPLAAIERFRTAFTTPEASAAAPGS